MKPSVTLSYKFRQYMIATRKDIKNRKIPALEHRQAI